MSIKRFIYNMLFNERQRRVIWKAVLFSEHTYKRRGNVDGAANVRQVINETAKIAATKQAVYLESQVAEIVKQEVEVALKGAQAKIDHAYRVGKVAGARKTLEEIKKIIASIDSNQVKPFTVDTAKCEKCKEANNCIIYQAILEVENDAKENDNEKGNEGAAAETTEKPDSVDESEIPVESDSEEKTKDGE